MEYGMHIINIFLPTSSWVKTQGWIVKKLKVKLKIR